MSGEEVKRVRRTVLFSGRVQGVGFRYTTRNVAAHHAITGFVQNLPDGRVQLVAEGNTEDIDRFIQAVQAEMSGHIHGQQDERSPATGEFTRFEVRH